MLRGAHYIGNRLLVNWREERLCVPSLFVCFCFVFRKNVLEYLLDRYRFASFSCVVKSVFFWLLLFVVFLCKGKRFGYVLDKFRFFFLPFLVFFFMNGMGVGSTSLS